MEPLTTWNLFKGSAVVKFGAEGAETGARTTGDALDNIFLGDGFMKMP
jgi:hypothetical protein